MCRADTVGTTVGSLARRNMQTRSAVLTRGCAASQAQRRKEMDRRRRNKDDERGRGRAREEERGGDTLTEHHTFRPNIRRGVPDFEHLQATFRIELAERKRRMKEEASQTKLKPFCLRSEWLPLALFLKHRAAYHATPASTRLPDRKLLRLGLTRGASELEVVEKLAASNHREHDKSGLTQEQLWEYYLTSPSQHAINAQISADIQVLKDSRSPSLPRRAPACVRAVLSLFVVDLPCACLRVCGSVVVVRVVVVGRVSRADSLLRSPTPPSLFLLRLLARQPTASRAADARALVGTQVAAHAGRALRSEADPDRAPGEQVDSAAAAADRSVDEADEAHPRDAEEAGGGEGGEGEGGGGGPAEAQRDVGDPGPRAVEAGAGRGRAAGQEGGGEEAGEASAPRVRGPRPRVGGQGAGQGDGAEEQEPADGGYLDAPQEAGQGPVAQTPQGQRPPGSRRRDRASPLRPRLEGARIRSNTRSNALEWAPGLGGALGVRVTWPAATVTQ
eukprot:3235166-Rhodomonas_salina.5